MRIHQRGRIHAPPGERARALAASDNTLPASGMRGKGPTKDGAGGELPYGAAAGGRCEVPRRTLLDYV
eukprot:5815747-Prymnesium_polylepis.1